MLTAIAAFLIDTVIGDPRTKLHPVVLMGNLISLLERLLYRQEDSDGIKFAKGALLVLLVLLISYSATAGLLQLSYYLPDWGSALAGGFILSFTISPKSLAQAGQELYTLLRAGDLAEARRKVSWIVGRDTDELDEPEIARATVETIAENTVDGIIAPLFFFALGGVPLAVLYRAANTMDSMLGYKNDKYLYFGRAAARLDDVLGLMPARITGVLFITSAALLGYDAHHAFRIMCRDAAKHPSPNGGYAEATVAGALHIRLGGYNKYFGKQHFRAYMGDALAATEPQHILRCIRMMYTATVLFLVCLYFIFQCWGYALY